MPLSMNAKEFRELLKTFTKLSKISSNTIAPISFAFEPFTVNLITENAFICSRPNASVLPPICSYSFNPEILMDLTFTDGDVELFWEDKNASLKLKNNYLRTALKIAVPDPAYLDIPEGINSFEVPLGLLHAVEKFMVVPYLFYTGKKELAPVWFRKNSEGMLEISVDDSCSLARFNTSIPVKLKNLDLKVPRYIFETLYSKGSIDDATVVKVGVHDDKSLFSNKTTQIYSSSIVDEDMETFDSVITDFKPMVSCDFSPKKLSEAIKPLVSLIPKKDKGSILSVNFSNTMSMNILHQEIGEGVIDCVDGVSNIYLEKSAKSVSINMVPQIFQEHTDLLNLPQASLCANNRMVFYKGSFSIGEQVINVEYVFPTAC